MDFRIYTIITHSLKLATYQELQTIYDVEDLMDMLEVIDVHETIEAVSRRRAEQANNNR